jgi:hypothetical protein
MNAVEGSDRAVVPMKLPNKEARRASGEVVEGRARTKEKRCGTPHEPDTERENSCPRGLRGVRDVRFRFHAIHPR